MWLVAGLASGTVLAFGDTGHLLPIFVPPILALAGLVGGLVGGLLYSWTRILAASATSAAVGSIILGGLSGGLAGSGLHLMGFGVSLAYGLVGGIVAGVISAWWVERAG